jgi:hypothetical protein
LDPASETADPALQLLLTSNEPAIRHAALGDLLDRPAADPDVRAARAAIARGPLVAGLLSGQRQDGGFGVHPYAKWAGAHWRLVSLMDLGVPPETPGFRAAAETVLDWLCGGHARNTPVIRGLARKCASQDGNGLAVSVYLGLAEDPRVGGIASRLMSWQWPDGGWNCDRKPEATHSSFNEALPAFLGLAEYARVTKLGDPQAAVQRAAEFVLRHRVILSERTGTLAHPNVARLRYPPYWHYDALAALKVLARSGHLADPRTADALDLLESKRQQDGTWHPDGFHWGRPGASGSNVEVVDWGRRGPSEPLTLGALRVLRESGRWAPPQTS